MKTCPHCGEELAPPRVERLDGSIWHLSCAEQVRDLTAAADAAADELRLAKAAEELQIQRAAYERREERRLRVKRESYQTHTLAMRGWAPAAIAAELGISPSAVRRYLSSGQDTRQDWKMQEIAPGVERVPKDEPVEWIDHDLQMLRSIERARALWPGGGRLTRTQWAQREFWRRRREHRLHAVAR